MCRHVPFKRLMGNVHDHHGDSQQQRGPVGKAQPAYMSGRRSGWNAPFIECVPLSQLQINKSGIPPGLD